MFQIWVFFFCKNQPIRGRLDYVSLFRGLGCDHGGNLIKSSGQHGAVDYSSGRLNFIM